MIEGIFIDLSFLALGAFFWWLFVRSIRLGQLEVRGGFRSVIIRRAEKPFPFWFNTIAFLVFAMICSLGFLFLAGGLIAGAMSQ